MSKLQEMGCGAGCMKIILIIVNFLVMAAGGTAIGLGIWALVSDYGADDMEAITGSGLYEAGCIIVIVGGSVVFLVSLFGACGACMENRCLLAMYFSVMILTLIVFAVAGVLGFFYRDDLRDRLEEKMEETLTLRYNVDEDGVSGEDHPSVTEVWDRIQRDLECCGVSGDLTSEKSWFLWQSSNWFLNAPALAVNKRYVPDSCCNPSFPTNQCALLSTDSQRPIQESLQGITEENPALFHKGCVDSLEDRIEDHVIAIAIVAVVTLGITLLCVFFSICLFLQIRSKNQVV